MSTFGSYTREQLRQSYLDAWRKHEAGAVLTPLEAMIAGVIGAHPEYQTMLQNAGDALARDANPANAGENPFLHMGLHMAVREQVAIDRPPGVRALHRALQGRFGTLHDAEHILMEALGETLWEAQRAGREPDQAEYLKLAQRRLTGASRG
jgi:hypothetical protein